MKLQVLPVIVLVREVGEVPHATTGAWGAEVVHWMYMREGSEESAKWRCHMLGGVWAKEPAKSVANKVKKKTLNSLGIARKSWLGAKGENLGATTRDACLFP